MRHVRSVDVRERQNLILFGQQGVLNLGLNYGGADFGFKLVYFGSVGFQTANRKLNQLMTRGICRNTDASAKLSPK
jgi:hypothetical protein